MKILLISTEKYPGDSAAVTRQHNLAKLFTYAGHEVLVIGLGKILANTKLNFDGIEYISLRSNHNSLIARIRNLLCFNSRLKKHIKNNAPYNVIILMSAPISTFLNVKKIGIRSNIKIIHDSVEWFSSSQFKLRVLSFHYQKKNMINKFIISKHFRVIAISKYLETYFLNKGCIVVRIPAILDVQNASCNKRTDPEKVTIIYAGNPGKKDCFKEIIIGLNMLNIRCIQRIELRIIGATLDEVKEITGLSNKIFQRLEHVINCIGTISRHEVLRNFEEADFSVLMRPPNQRYSKAGFPTKIVESLASGTPVICNITSDLGDYIRDNENGIVVSELSSRAFACAIEKILGIPFFQRVEMFEESRKSAEKYFDYKLYSEKVNELLSDYE